MDVQLQELIDKIKRDGVSSAENEAKEIVSKAEKQAAAILKEAEEKYLHILALAMQNLSSAGGKRNRGFGEIRCTMTNQEKLVEQAIRKDAV